MEPGALDDDIVIGGGKMIAGCGFPDSCDFAGAGKIGDDKSRTIRGIRKAAFSIERKCILAEIQTPESSEPPELRVRGFNFDPLVPI